MINEDVAQLQIIPEKKQMWSRQMQTNDAEKLSSQVFSQMGFES